MPVSSPSQPLLSARTSCGALLALALAGPLAARDAARIKEPVVESDRVTLHGNIPHRLAERTPRGRSDQAKVMDRVILALKLSPEAKSRLDRHIAEQQDPASPEYHRWLTPAQFGEQFGPAPEDLAQVMSWLSAQDFTIETIAPGGLTINFSGDVQKIERAFRTTIMDFDLEDRSCVGNIDEPSIPRALASVVHGVVSLHSLPRPAHSPGVRRLTAEEARMVAARRTPQWRGTANGAAGVYTSPVDWATIYNAQETYRTNGTGTGVVIGIVGRTNPGPANWNAFRSQVGLPVSTPSIVINGPDPGSVSPAENGEADLDVEWAGGCAPGATVTFVTSRSTSSTDGVDLSAQYIVDNNLADVMSVSFGQCESTMGSAETSFFNNLWAQAAAQGITVCVATGDSGAAGCETGNALSGAGKAGINGLASTPHNIGVGATQLSDSGAYWTSAGLPIGYIPEAPWNESGTVSGGSGLWATSSGPSNLYGKPAWQVAPGVPSSGQRHLPDVSLDGSNMFFGNYGMLVQTEGSMGLTGGTSASSPSFAGVMALVVQKYGRQGNANPRLYQLGQAQYSGTGPAVFHDILSGHNDVPGMTGYPAGAGWDGATGLGTPDVTALVNNWGAAAAPAPQP